MECFSSINSDTKSFSSNNPENPPKAILTARVLPEKPGEKDPQSRIPKDIVPERRSHGASVTVCRPCCREKKGRLFECLLDSGALSSGGIESDSIYEICLARLLTLGEHEDECAFLPRDEIFPQSQMSKSFPGQPWKQSCQNSQGKWIDKRGCGKRSCQEKISGVRTGTLISPMPRPPQGH
uniref:Uncharacterized protein n=1 Tax=Entomoneis paludosa TaxID=265537 RepID=A0A7S2YHY2_9STRA|mmetsp:Transcript_33796/g.70259  ORF Transcript_33796/g.70259 Transcript_33796/m.70259 type:complete len:181 (+) Transcript_33796:810-1352(+)